ncbi:hypothetical protein H70357_07775 [Paenibacillus sp. FSL H7-0357]|nr:hypothetical protein H70357_07775 [Paenibacillus sp. FSL H7-0357]
MYLDNGPDIGSIVLDDFFTFKEKNLEIRKETLLLFTSIYCIKCIQSLPLLKKLSDSFDLILFSNGLSQDIEEMITNFKWGFPVISINEEHMEKHFSIRVHPSFILINEQRMVCSTGVINDFSDLKNLSPQKKSHSLLRLLNNNIR